MANLFPRWTNWIPLKLVVILFVLGNAAVAGVWYYFTPKYTRVGYQPVQPVPFSHEIHAGQLGMDCRYCHSFVEVSYHSNVPNTQVCMNCHSQIQKDNPKLEAVRQSWQTGQPVTWIQLHKTPDYAYYNHSVHVNRGISCVSCHGQVNHMAVVYHDQPLSMSWCLDCHRHPENALRPREAVYNLDWKPSDVNAKDFVAKYGKPPGEEDRDFSSNDVKLTQQEIGLTLKHAWYVNPPENCAGCHR
jgi:hypothetical protein